MGIDMRNEKVEAAFLSTPKKVKLEIVAPLLDTPGNTAIPCKKPLNMLVLTDKVLFCFNFRFSPTNKSVAVSTNPNPKNPPVSRLGNASLKRSASATVGTQASTKRPLVF